MCGVQYVQEGCVWCTVCTGELCVVYSMYRRVVCGVQYVQEGCVWCTVCTRGLCVVYSMYRRVVCGVQDVCTGAMLDCDVRSMYGRLFNDKCWIGG